MLEITERKYLSKEEVSDLKRIIERYMKSNERDCLLLKVAMVTGARAQEILNIKSSDLGKETIYIRGLKKGNNREVPVNKTLLKQLKQLAKRHGEDRVFPITYPRLDQIWKQYRPVEKKFHSLRHTAAMALFKKTKDIRLVKYLLGHKHLSTTEIYVNYMYTRSELRKAIL